jgi:hypothetical protein
MSPAVGGFWGSGGSSIISLMGGRATGGAGAPPFSAIVEYVHDG